jgi:hypothetical protein
MFGDTREHPGTDLFAVVKRENEIRPASALHRAMRAGLALKLPTDPDQRRKDAALWSKAIGSRGRDGNRD